MIKEITDFAKDLFSQGNDLDSTRVSLEGKWPHLTGNIGVSWLQRVADKVAAEDFAKCHFAQGKDLESIRMSLKKQWPHLSGCFEFSWLEHLTNTTVVVDSDPASANLDNVRQLHNNLKAARQLSQLAKFVKHHFSKGKDLELIRMLLQKKWPHLTDFFNVSWLEHLTEGVVVVDSYLVSNRCWRCELEMEVSGITKCCKHFNEGSER